MKECYIQIQRYRKSIEREKGAYHSLVLQDGMYDVLPRSDSNLKINTRVDVHMVEKKPKFNSIS